MDEVKRRFPLCELIYKQFKSRSKKNPTGYCKESEFKTGIAINTVQAKQNQWREKQSTFHAAEKERERNREREHESVRERVQKREREWVQMREREQTKRAKREGAKTETAKMRASKWERGCKRGKRTQKGECNKEK